MAARKTTKPKSEKSAPRTRKKAEPAPEVQESAGLSRAAWGAIWAGLGVLTLLALLPIDGALLRWLHRFIGGFIGRGFEEFAEYRALVREARAHGAHFIKIMISGLMDFDHYGVLTDAPLPLDLIRDMIACAHDAGFSVMAHANGDKTVRAALAGGVDSIEHGAYLTDETLCQLAESHAVWVPTLVTIGNLIGCGRFPDTVLKPLLAYQMNAVQKAAALGAKIACGSDAGAYRVLHGQGGLDEHTLLRRAIGEGADTVTDAGNAVIMARF